MQKLSNGTVASSSSGFSSECTHSHNGSLGSASSHNSGSGSSSSSGNSDSDSSSSSGSSSDSSTTEGSSDDSSSTTTTQELVEVIDALEVEEVETGVGSFDSEEEEENDCAASQKGIGYEAMRLINPGEQMPMCVTKVKEVTSYLENKGSSGPHVERYLRTALNAWQMKGANVAVIGDKQCGKSLLINYLSGRRGPKNEPVKLPKKSCKRPKSYEHVINPSLQFWEIPIGGYEKWGNKKTYWDLIDGDKYDAFLLLTKNYVKGQMTWLSGLLKERGIPHIIIRTGIDEAIETSYKKYPLSHNAERIKWNAIKFMRESYVENGGKNDVDTNFYVIGSMHPEKYDMPRVLDNLMNNPSESIRTSIALSMPPHSPAVIETKINALKQRIWLVAVESAAAGARVPNTEIYADFKMIKDEIALYRKQLDISDEVLELVSSMDDPLSGIHNIKFDNKPLIHMLAHSISQNEDYEASLVPQIKNVSFRWWLTHQKAAPTFQAVGGLMIFLLMNFEDLCKRMLLIKHGDQLNECAV